MLNINCKNLLVNLNIDGALFIIMTWIYMHTKIIFISIKIISILLKTTKLLNQAEEIFDQISPERPAYCLESVQKISPTCYKYFFENSATNHYSIK